MGEVKISFCNVKIVEVIYEICSESKNTFARLFLELKEDEDGWQAGRAAIACLKRTNPGIKFFKIGRIEIKKRSLF